MLVPQRLLCLLFLVLVPPSASAAEIAILPPVDGVEVVAVAGELLAGDAERFDAVLGSRSGGLAVLAGPGGSARDGMKIGETIRARGFSTVVLTGMECVSACAIAWLGGVERKMQAGAAIGFHGAYQDEAGTAQTSSSGNALVGAYLTRLGFPIDTVYWATAYSPDRLLYIDKDVAEEMGLTFVRLPLGWSPADVAAVPHRSPPPRTEPSAPRVAEADPVAAAAIFVDRHFAAAAPADGNPAYVSATYVDAVDYFGARLTRGDVLNRRAAYVSRWPVSSVWRTGPPTITCDAGDRCVIRGPAAFAASDPRRNAKSEGSFFYRFEVTLRDDRILIVGEENAGGERWTGEIDVTRPTVVQSVQKELDRHGCAPGPADGSWGPRSIAALARFARVTGRAVDRGPVGPDTLAHLRRAAAPMCARVAATRDPMSERR